MIFHALLLFIFSGLVFPPLCVPSIHGDSIYADAFQGAVLKKTGIKLEKIGDKAYKFLAQHAWPSWFRGQDNGNDFSIGIELVGKGFTDQGGKRSFYAYPESQVKSLGLLLQKLVKQYGIAPENIFSHGDFSPQRKYDVTILFPWKTLYAKYGMGMGLGAEERTREGIVKKYNPTHALPKIFDPLFFQSMLSKIGYDTRFAQDPSLSEGSKKAQWHKVYQVFYAHFSRNGQPQRWRGAPDLQDMFWAWALVAKYFSFLH